MRTIPVEATIASARRNYPAGWPSCRPPPPPRWCAPVVFMHTLPIWPKTCTTTAVAAPHARRFGPQQGSLALAIQC